MIFAQSTPRLLTYDEVYGEDAPADQTQYLSYETGPEYNSVVPPDPGFMPDPSEQALWEALNTAAQGAANAGASSAQDIAALEPPVSPEVRYADTINVTAPLPPAVPGPGGEPSGGGIGIGWWLLGTGVAFLAAGAGLYFWNKKWETEASSEEIPATV